MAVIIKKKALTITSLVNRLFDTLSNVSLDGLLNKADELEATGHTLLISPTTFSIAAPGNANVLSVTQLKLETVQLAYQQKVSNILKGGVQSKVIDLVTTAHDKLANAKVSLDALASKKVFTTPALAKHEVMHVWHTTNNKVMMIKKFRKLTNFSLKESKDLCEAWIVEDVIVPEIISVPPKVETIEVITSKGAVPLREATRLHQPVNGTDSSSVYHVIAIGKTCIIAARIKQGNNVAIRAEIVPHHATKEAQSTSKALVAAGLDKKGGGHYSLHLDPPDFNMVRRSIGSILFATGIDFNGISLNLIDIQGAGK